MEPLRREMAEYLKKVLEQGSYKDLVQTREQIHSCFQKVGSTHRALILLARTQRPLT